MGKSWSEKEAHAIEAHDDEALETHETEPECLHRWMLARICEVCGEEERIFTDIFSENVPPTRTR